MVTLNASQAKSSYPCMLWNPCQKLNIFIYEGEIIIFHDISSLIVPKLPRVTHEDEIFHDVPRGTHEGEIFHDIPRGMVLAINEEDTFN